MGSGASISVKVVDVPITDIYSVQLFQGTSRRTHGWEEVILSIDKDSISVSTIINATSPILVLPIEKEFAIFVDRTDESRCPILDIRQLDNTLRIKTKNESDLTELTMRINQNVALGDNGHNESRDRALQIMFERFNNILEDNITEESLETTTHIISRNKLTSIPSMNIVILVVGTRGDVQPFVYLGQSLRRYGHRVRLATHAEYRSFVLENGLEFYPLAGDPKKLSSYMVKTGGRLLPDLLNEEERHELPEKMKMLKDICYSTWPACTAADPEDIEHRSFVADAIISNPVSYGHIHCAEALCIPLHIMFPQPWSPTKCFPHPLSNMSLKSAWSTKNYYSYKLVDEFMWLGLGFMINSFRQEVLMLPPLRTGNGGDSILNDNKVPISHMWSPSFVPKCPDWPTFVDVVGEFRKLDIDQGSSFKPHPAFENYLLECRERFADQKSKSKPVYVGFGSMVIEDSERLLNIVKNAAEQVNCMIVLQSGWTKFAEDNTRLSEHVFVVGNMPHDWLFQQVSAVVHHGGAGTTSAGLRAGNPTFICPFFGDQHFWAEMVHRCGAGPSGCSINKLDTEKFIDALQILTTEETQKRASELANLMNEEDGVTTGQESFHRQLPIADMICEVSVFQRRCHLATVYCSNCGLKMSEEVDSIIHRSGSGRENHVRVPFRCVRWNVCKPTTVLQGLGHGVGAVAYEVAGSLYDLVAKPMQGGKEGGALGAVKGIASGLHGLIARPIKGGGILIDKVKQGATRGRNDKSVDVESYQSISRKYSKACSKDSDDLEYNDNDVSLDILNSKRGGQLGLKQFLQTTVDSNMTRKQLIVNNSNLNDTSIAMTETDTTCTEIENALDAAHRFMEIWMKLDSSGDRLIGLSELEQLLPPSEAAALMRAADLNMDGELTFTELATQMMQFVSI